MSRMKPEALLGSEKALLDEFLALTREQVKLLEAEDIDGFRASLEKRRPLIEEIDAMKPALEALTGLDAQSEQIRLSIGETLQQIKELNDQNNETLKRLMAQLSDEIKETNLNQKGLGGYGQRPMSFSSEYFDTKF